MKILVAEKKSLPFFVYKQSFQTLEYLIVSLELITSQWILEPNSLKLLSNLTIHLQIQLKISEWVHFLNKLVLRWYSNLIARNTFFHYWINCSWSLNRILRNVLKQVNLYADKLDCLKYTEKYYLIKM